jgi:hypothetical protein
MSSLQFNCSYCESSFLSNKALNIHITKMHQQNKVNQCSICGNNFAKTYTYKRHMITCNAKNQVMTQRIEEVSKIKTELLVKEVECQYQKQISDLLQQHIETVKVTAKAPTTINNITNINNVYNNNRSYTQQNNFLSDNFEKLVPITEKSLKENFKQVFDEARLNKQYLSSEKDIGIKLTTGPLKESLICTDASRGIVHWKDGDNDNKHIKDPLCLSLSNKMFNAIANNLELVDDYKNFLNEKQDSFNINTLPEEALSCCDSSVMLNQLAKSDTIAKIAKTIAKNVPSELTFVKKEFKFEKLFTLIQQALIDSPHKVLLQNASGISKWFFNILQSYGYSTKVEKDYMISLKDDENTIILLTQKEVLTILRNAFERIENYAFTAKTYLSKGIFPLIFSTKMVEDVEICEDNFKKFDSWIKEEDIESFEKSFIHYYDLFISKKN